MHICIYNSAKWQASLGFIQVQLVPERLRQHSFLPQVLHLLNGDLATHELIGNLLHARNAIIVLLKP